MALKKRKLNHYIKLDLDGTFTIYKNTKSRQREKAAPTYEKVIAMYKTMLAHFKNNKERLYYDHSFYLLMCQWEAEYERYQQMHDLGQTDTDFPLMSQYIPNIGDSLPEILCKGRVGLLGNTLAEIYENAKRCGYFGNVEDC